eukprot:SAG31_NODE_5897_length_2267_cov_1.670664_3_plen_144_part_00
MLSSNSGWQLALTSAKQQQQEAAPAIEYNATADRSKVTPAMKALKAQLQEIQASYASIPSHTPEYSAARQHYAQVKKQLGELSAARAVELGQINAARFKHLQEVGEAAKAAKLAAHDEKVGGVVTDVSVPSLIATESRVWTGP